MSDTLRAHPNVKIILSHAGGTLPHLALRPAILLSQLNQPAEKGIAGTKSADEFLDEARSFYFDSVLSASHLTLDLLKGFAKPGHVLFGSDFPYAPNPAIEHMDKLLDEYGKEDETLSSQSITLRRCSFFRN